MIISKMHKYSIWALALQYKTLNAICILPVSRGNHNHALVQEHSHRVHAIILGLQLIYTSSCECVCEPGLVFM